jgi:hypothetical protein
LVVALVYEPPVHVSPLAEIHATETKRKPVVVELFTSEGCSTCPPADALLAKLSREQPVQDAEIIAIEEHVDYWNQQGWVDPFSSLEWTLRQQEYIAKFKEKEVYTPQMVVDGQRQFIGSREQEAQDAVQEAAQQEKAEIRLSAERSSATATLRVNVSVGELRKTDAVTPEVWLGITENDLGSVVKTGENAGRDLRHAAVLRWLRKVGVASGNGERSFVTNIEVKLKSSWKPENLHVVAFVQDKKTWRILGATSASVPN